MNMKKFLGTTLFIKTIKSVEFEWELELSSIFEALIDDDQFLITAPIHKGAVFPISLKETLYVHFFTSDGRYDFTCSVTERPVIKGLYYLKIQLTSEVVRSQRRDYFRVKKALRAKASIEATADVDAKNHPETKHIEGLTGAIESECLTHDISAGGISLYMTHACALNDIVIVSLPVGPNERMIKFRTEVVWVGKSSKKPEFSYIAGLQFIYEGNDEKERMVKYVFMLQYEMIRNKPIT